MILAKRLPRGLPRGYLLPKQHDKFFRAAMSNKRVATAFFRQHLPCKISTEINLDTLQLQKESFVDSHLDLKITDILYSVKWKNKSGLLYLLVEHQSGPDKNMPMRVWQYVTRIMQHHISLGSSADLPVVYPMVFYHGRRPYLYSTNLFDRFAEHKELAKSILLSPFQLIDVGKIEDADLKEDSWSGAMQLVMKHAFDQDIIPSIQEMAGLLRDIEQQGGVDFIESMFAYIVSSSEAKDHKRAAEIIMQGLAAKVGGKIMTIAESFYEDGWNEGVSKGISKGISQGIAKGITKGERQARENVAERLLADGFEISYVAKVTDLPKPLIEHLLASLR